MLIREKVLQAADLLRQFDIDCWLTFVRESEMLHDPMLDFLVASHLTWPSALLVTAKGESFALVGQLDRKAVDDLEVYDRVLDYVEGLQDSLIRLLRELQPGTIAVNFSQDSEICDGLTHGMYLTLEGWLEKIGWQDRLVSAERICSCLKARKTPEEIRRIQSAIDHTEDIFRMVGEWIRPGMTERQIAEFMTAEVRRRGLTPGWGSHCPAVFTGPDTAGAHYRPTERVVEPGHILNMDFGVRCEGYVSDMQRTFYILEPGQDAAPPEVQRGFDTLRQAIELARQAIRPGAQGIGIDRLAREWIVAQGYAEFPHALGHQVGRYAHDGTALLGPAWPKYARRPFLLLEEGMVFTIEPRLTVFGRGVVTMEEIVRVASDDAPYLTRPQKELILV